MAKWNASLLLKRLGPKRFVQLLYHLPNFLRLFLRLIKDARVSVGPKLLVILTLAYVVSPVDLIPDFVPVLGQLDDLMIIFMGLRLFVRLCPKDVVNEHVRAIAAGRGRPEAVTEKLYGRSCPTDSCG